MRAQLNFHFSEAKYNNFINQSFIFLPNMSICDIEDSQGNRVVEQSQVLKIWENYITKLYDRTNRPETLDVEPEEEVDTDEKDPYILKK
jgi:hypothetical protein